MARGGHRQQSQPVLTVFWTLISRGRGGGLKKKHAAYLAGLNTLITEKPDKTGKKTDRTGKPEKTRVVLGKIPVLYVGPGPRRNTVIFGQTVYRRRRYRQKSKNRQPFKKYRHFAAPPWKYRQISEVPFPV